VKIREAWEALGNLLNLFEALGSLWKLGETHWESLQSFGKLEKA
jgi:hypothetical protein